MNASLIFRSVSKVYRDASGAERYALRNASFELPAKQRVALIGRSGSGKSTLLHLAAGIDIPTSGEVILHNRSLETLDDAERTRMRRQDVALIFQFFHLLPHLSVRDNVALPDMIRGEDPRTTDARIETLLRRVGLLDRWKDPVQKLSGGEMQRVAICRALLPGPRLLLADEPTGNLDDATSRQILDLLLEMTHEANASLLMVTHSRDIAARADAVWSIHDGVLTTAAAS